MRRRLVWASSGALVFAIAIAVGCADDARGTPDPIYTSGPIVPPASRIIGPAGGTVASSDGASIVVPAGALEADTTITITSDPSAPLPVDMTAAGTPVLLEPEGLRFAAPVRVTMPLAAGPPSRAIGVYRAPRGTIAFEPLTGATQDGASVTAETLALGVFVPATVACAGACSADPDAGTCACSGRCLGVAYAVRCADGGCACQNDASTSAACLDVRRTFRETCLFPGTVDGGE